MKSVPLLLFPFVFSLLLLLSLLEGVERELPAPPNNEKDEAGPAEVKPDKAQPAVLKPAGAR